MTLYQINYPDGKTTYTLLPTKLKSENAFKCDECSLSFSTELRLKYHRATHSPLKKHQQPKRRQQKEGSVVATAKKLSSLTYMCPSCDFSTDRRDVMITHFTTLHKTQLKDEITIDEGTEEETAEAAVEANDSDSNNDAEAKNEDGEEELANSEYRQPVQLTCTTCGSSYDNQVDFDFHSCEDASGEQKMFTCHLCTFECLTRTGLQSHVTRKHRPNPEGSLVRTYACDDCEYTCTNRRTMYSHRRKHRELDSGEPPASFFCDECDFKTRTKGALYLHIQRRHKAQGEPADEDEDEQPDKSTRAKKPSFYKCEQCDYTNKTRYEIKVHVMRKHSSVFNHECKTCGKKYKIRGDLTNHIRFQHREQPIICDVCGKTCGNSNSLYVHQKFAHYKAEFECHICHRRMVSQANLDEHVLKQHEQRVDVVCDECGKVFTRQSRLKIHMRIHSGIKPYNCKICGKDFARKTALRQHLLIHSGQRPYQCDICGKSFTQKPGLISHRKSHPGSHPPLPRVTIDHVLSDLLNEDS